MTCRSYFCEIALHQQNLVPAYASAQQSRHLSNFSDQPARSVHLAKYEQSEKTLYTKCELDGNKVQSLSRISEYEFEQK